MKARLLLLGFLILIRGAQAADEPLTSVSHVDLAKYAGSWYEIARFPNAFQKGCDEATANYQPREDGSITVINTCRKQSDGSEDRVEGIAQVVDKTTFSKLKVSFLPKWLRWTGIGEGDYWVILLQPQYEWAVVSEPRRRYLWILARQPALSEATYTGILSELKARHFDTSLLIPSRPASAR